MSTDLTTARASVLTLNEDSPPERFEETRGMLDALKERVRELDDQWRTAALGRCVEHGEMVLMGHRKFYAAVEKETKCVNVRGAIEGIYEATGGDFDALVGCLSANALKPAATRGVLTPEKYAETFATTEKTKLKSGEAKGEKALVEVNTDYVR